MFAYKAYNTGGAGEYYPDSSVAPYYLTDIKATIFVNSGDESSGGWNVGKEDSYINAINAPTSTGFAGSGNSDLIKDKINWDFKYNLYTVVGGPPNSSFYNVFDSSTITFYDVKGYSYYGGDKINEISLILWSETGTGIGDYGGAGQYNDLGFIPNSPHFILGRNTTNNTNTYGSNLVKQSNTNTSSYSHFYLIRIQMQGVIVLFLMLNIGLKYQFGTVQVTVILLVLI